MTDSTSAGRRERARLAAEPYGGVVSRALLRRLGVTRHHIRREVEAQRWATHGTQTVALHTRSLSDTERQWCALWEVGQAVAALDGVSALVASGLKGFTDPLVHVSVPHTCRVGQPRGVRLHKITRRLPSEVVQVGVTRVRSPVAAIRAAHWAASDRQAALILLLAVQQRIVSPAQLTAAAGTATGRRRRAFVRAAVGDITDGVHSLGELDFARLCRQRGLPEPSRQVVRRGPRGRIYLDVRWAGCGLVVEIDGAQHRHGLAVTADNLRQNEVTLTGDIVLRIDVIGLRLAPDAFMAQVEAALRQCRPEGTRLR